MEFWGAEVKVGESVKVDPAEFEACIHLSQAALGEAKKDKSNEPVVLYLKVGQQKFVLGTLSREKIPQIPLELVLEKEFELSHNSKNASVHFCGYKAFYDTGDDSEEDEFTDSEEDVPLLKAENGKPETKAEELKVPESKKAVAKASASAKQVKIVEPKKDNEEDSDDDSDEDDDFGSSDEEMEDADSDSDDESDDKEDDDEETHPKNKKADLGKKRPNESASKTPVSSKKAKNATPEKTDGKKGGHTATPHPAKKGGKTPSSEAKAKTPNNEAKTPMSGGLSCKSCSKSFNSESGLQQHNKAKHGGQ
uniref:C2H2-type domain-containing protein n=1 Tax=Glycine max TaxID=3847 RepID=C6TJ33_SOYBN|nr:unknown [Glycine max]|eukprot:NP_001242333.1 uncharacterized protein LOC100795506 [Glycine max]